jgi:hypothetical protein
MWGTSSPDDKLADDLGSAIEGTRIGGCQSDFFTAEKLAPGNLGLLQQYRHYPVISLFGLMVRSLAEADVSCGREMVRLLGCWRLAALQSVIGILNGIRFRSAGQRRHHHGRRSAIGVLLSLSWAIWSLRASAASRTCARQASPWSRHHCEWPLAAACCFTAPMVAPAAVNKRLTVTPIQRTMRSAQFGTGSLKTPNRPAVNCENTRRAGR